MDIAKYIDHTILKPDATVQEIIRVCDEAKEHGFAAVCVNPYYLPLVSKELKGSKVQACVVAGFPLGAETVEVKALAARQAVRDGAEEVDMVINIGALKSGNLEAVGIDILAVVKAVAGEALVKVIIESCLLTDQEKETACKIAVEQGASFVKTSTGFSSGGATAADVKLMRKTVGKLAGVKASGGIRDYVTALKMIEAGANRIGSSSGVIIMKQAAKA